jgi:hypothetical protein
MPKECSRFLTRQELKELRFWVDEHCPTASFAGDTWLKDWLNGVNDKWSYEYLFATKDEAMKFKLVWG